MYHHIFVLFAGLVTCMPTQGVGSQEKRLKSPEKLYETFRGPWQTLDDKSPLSVFQLHRYEKAQLSKDFVPTWGVSLSFKNLSPESYSGPVKVESEGDGLKIILPPPPKGEKREARYLHMKRDGDKLKLRVVGGDRAGTYELKRVNSKQ